MNIPTIENLTGTWVSECTHPAHLGDLGCIIKFYFDELPFDNYAVLRITSTVDKKETVLFTGPYKIEPSINDEFFIVVEEKRIPARQFNDTTFIADLDNYGVMILIKQ